MTAARCGWVRAPNGLPRFWIPHCMGGAVYGERGCTCSSGPTPAERIAELERRIAELERQAGERQ